MKHYLTILATTLFVSMTACVSEKIELRNTTDKLTVTATQTTSTEPTTKTTFTSYSEGMHVAWAENDKIRIIQTNGSSYTAVDLSLKDGAGSQTATFEGNNFPDVYGASNLKYQAFYPSTIEGTSPELWKGNASYEGQIQKGNDNTDHLAAFDYLETQQVDNIEESLKFMHLGLVFCFDITIPKSETAPQSFTLTTINDENSPTTEGGLFKNCNQEKTSSITLNFQDCTTTTPTFKAYMMCNCNIPAMQKILATLTLQDGSTYTSNLTAQQTISSTQANGKNEGISYVVPISDWKEIKNSVFNADTKAEKFTGTGTNKDPYIIESAENLKYLIESNNTYESKYFSLKTNLTIEDGTTWTPIGNQKSFNGYFNGNGHTVKGTINSCTTSYIGFFGQVNNATISNLNSEINITNETCTNIGGIIGQASSTTITNCHYNGTINAGSNADYTYAGGIVGFTISYCTIKQCSSRGNIRQNPITLMQIINFGGITGKSFNTTFSQCTNYAEVKGGKQDKISNAYIGGINGNVKDCKLEECYNYGEIYGSSFININDIRDYCTVGGISGQTTSSEMSHVYNYGSVHAQQSKYSNYAGGITGNVASGREASFNDCTNFGEVIGYGINNVLSYTGGLIGNVSQVSCKIHQCHNAGNVSVVTDSPNAPNIYVGSYVGYIQDINRNYIYNCNSTAEKVIIKGANGEIVSALQPNFYIGNNFPLVACPDSHTVQNN